MCIELLDTLTALTYIPLRAAEVMKYENIFTVLYLEQSIFKFVDWIFCIGEFVVECGPAQSDSRGPIDSLEA